MFNRTKLPFAWQSDCAALFFGFLVMRKGNAHSLDSPATKPSEAVLPPEASASCSIYSSLPRQPSVLSQSSWKGFHSLATGATEVISF